MEVARGAGAAVVGAAAIIDRGTATDLGVPFHALARIVVPAWEPGACPLCAEGQPIVKPGSRPTP